MHSTVMLMLLDLFLNSHLGLPFSGKENRATSTLVSIILDVSSVQNVVLPLLPSPSTTMKAPLGGGPLYFVSVNYKDF